MHAREKSVPLIIIGILFLLWGIWVQTFSTFNLFNLMVSGGGLLLLLYGLSFRRLNEALPRWLKRMVLILVALVCAFILFLFVYGQADTDTGKEDAVIVLGAGLRGDRLSLVLKERLDSALEYAEENPEALIVVSGGQGRGETITEAKAMSRYLIARGVPEDRILREGKSTSTAENFRYSKAILDEVMEGDYTVVYITNDFHLFRAGILAGDAGLTANRKGAKLEWYLFPMTYLREIAACANTFLLKWTGGSP